MTSNLLVEGNYFYGNGVPGSYLEHNVYCEANGITYEYNDFGPLRSGSAGAELKDRSAGAVIAYNYFSPAADHPRPRRRRGFADAAGRSPHTQIRMFTGTYSIIPAQTRRAILVHFGGDSGDTSIYRPNLYFYDNTVVNVVESIQPLADVHVRAGYQRPERVCRQQHFLQRPGHGRQQPRPSFEFAMNQGNMTFSPTNWVSPGWLTSESAELEPKLRRHDHRHEQLLRRPEQQPSHLSA